MTVATAKVATQRTAPVGVPLDLRTALHRAATRLAHAANLAGICADGTAPERGAEHVLGIIAELEEEFALFRTIPPQP